MKCWFSLVLTFWLAFNLLIIASISFGRSRSAPDAFTTPRIGQCNNTPCVQNVIAGITSWDDVTARFATVPDSTATGDKLTLGANTFIQTTFNADGRGDKVDSIRVTFAIPYLTLATLVTQYGIPCKLRLYASGGVQVIYPRVTATLEVTSDLSSSLENMRFSSDVEVSQLDFLAETNSCALQESDPANLYHDEHWHGFSDLDEYYRN